MRKCRISHHDAQNILNTVCDELAPKLVSLAEPALPKDETFTTGDALLDRLLGGGIRTGKLWEVVGERYVHLNASFITVSQKDAVVLQARHNW